MKNLSSLFELLSYISILKLKQLKFFTPGRRLQKDLFIHFCNFCIEVFKHKYFYIIFFNLNILVLTSVRFTKALLEAFLNKKQTSYACIFSLKVDFIQLWLLFQSKLRIFVTETT